MNKQYLIGEFSYETGVSKRMLRHYEKLELLSPHHIDEDNGYRFYSKDQIAMVKKIQHLQDFGFTLKSIKDLLNKDMTYDDFVLKLKDQEAILRNDADVLTHHLLKLKSFINYVESHPTQVDDLPLNEFEIERSIVMTNKNLKDEIRNLPRSQVFFERLEEIVAERMDTNAVFITFDIDDFIHVNDAYGYDVGDQVIALFYKQIRDNFASILSEDPDNQFTRVGGDEFALFILNPDKQRIQDTTEATLTCIRDYNYNSLGCHRQMTSSCGIAFGSTDNDHRELRHKSTKALLEAKRCGRDQLFIL